MLETPSATLDYALLHTSKVSPRDRAVGTRATQHKANHLHHARLSSSSQRFLTPLSCVHVGSACLSCRLAARHVCQLLLPL
ncbi:hypothetical protein VFPFJ_00362 [Purpureocillium lilacinum]|uniref:Uncharacterized protein n=1 Tax=Purpureocillium lilacinum TaxID=33203 RepID=A0A179HY48_PURLI|nr:hypothetical protein VFPFJ_00362 [Purpureocillium lilacinum]OAQ86293.1 hypothetical protein VFPBJ_00333 [Purpureocillium lilacinum]OAQ94253.1 hypothetical protein VFPFJ_00362 [Purpureocillium lilacinum]